MKILFIGDIVGKPGRKVVSRVLRTLKKEMDISFVIANGENITHGKGINLNHYKFLMDAGIDCVTLGNHYDDRFELKYFIEEAVNLIRPLNIKDKYPGSGSKVFRLGNAKIRVTNILGQVFMDEAVGNPFETLDVLLKNEEPAEIHIVDFHAEATSEKYAMGMAFDGRVSAVLGTHTHIQTNDARIFASGTGYISDVGMCGPYDSVLGVKKETVIERLWHEKKTRFEVEEELPYIFNGVLLDIDEKTGHTTDIKIIKKIIDSI